MWLQHTAKHKQEYAQVAIEFSEREVVRRTARALGQREANVQEVIDTYAYEWLRLARQADYQPVIPGMERVA